MVEHAVEGGAHLADLGVRVALGLRDALAEVHLAGVQGEFGDPGGGGGDLAQRAGGDTDEDVPGDTGGDEPGGGDADLDEDQRVDVVVGLLGRDGDVVGAVGPADVLRAVTAQAGDVHGVLAVVTGDGVQSRELRLGQRLGAHREVVVGLVADLAVGRVAVLHLGHERVLRRLRRAADELSEIDRMAALLSARPTAGPDGVLALAGRTELPGRPGPDLAQLAVQLRVQMRAQRQRRHRPDHRAHHGDQHHGRDDEPGPQGARLSLPHSRLHSIGGTPMPLLRTRPSSPCHEAAGLIR